jgi:hypothetical protein
MTKSGPLVIKDGIVDLSEWSKEEPDGTLVVTAPKAWDGIVQERDVHNCKEFDGSSLVSYGTQGLVNHRDYLRRYVPWRHRHRDLPARFESSEHAPSNVTLRLATLITTDIDFGGTPELVAYTFVIWTDANHKTVALDGEVGILWRNEKKAPAVISGLTDQPGAFTLPDKAPAWLNGGNPLVFSVDYCCATTTVRSANVVSGLFSNVHSEAENGEWQVYLESSKASSARLLIATGKPIDENSLKE